MGSDRGLLGVAADEHRSYAPYVNAPHFEISEDGILVQYLDEDAYPDDSEERLEAGIDALDAGLLD